MLFFVIFSGLQTLAFPLPDDVTEKRNYANATSAKGTSQERGDLAEVFLSEVCLSDGFIATQTGATNDSFGEKKTRGIGRLLLVSPASLVVPFAGA